jgi:mRNA interferase MazF
MIYEYRIRLHLFPFICKAQAAAITQANTLQPCAIIRHVNRFLEWIGLKQKLHRGTQVPPLVSAGDIWWASIGENVGSEINGKSRLFSRPVIVFKKLAHGFYFVIPTTTKSKIGSWYVSFRQADRKMIASLHQARAIDHRRLSTKLGQLDDSDFQKVREGFWNLYK